MGRLLVKHGKMYNFNLSTKDDPEEEKCKALNENEELLVDLEIDGLHGPIAKIVKPEAEKKKVWIDNDKDEIEEFETSEEKLNAISGLAEKIAGSLAAQISSEPSKPSEQESKSDQDVAKEAAKEATKEVAEATANEVTKEATEETAKETTKEATKDTAKEAKKQP